MDIVEEKDYEEVAKLAPKPIPKEEEKPITESEFNGMMEEMQNPVLAQQQIAIKIKQFLDKKIKDEMDKKGYLTNQTRLWILSYNSILESIQKSLHGDKSVNLHLHKVVSHSVIAEKIRKV